MYVYVCLCLSEFSVSVCLCLCHLLHMKVLKLKNFVNDINTLLGDAAKANLDSVQVLNVHVPLAGVTLKEESHVRDFLLVYARGTLTQVEAKENETMAKLLEIKTTSSAPPTFTVAPLPSFPSPLANPANPASVLSGAPLFVAHAPVPPPPPSSAAAAAPPQRKKKKKVPEDGPKRAKQESEDGANFVCPLCSSGRCSVTCEVSVWFENLSAGERKKIRRRRVMEEDGTVTLIGSRQARIEAYQEEKKRKEGN
jgi:hypothetical protein